MKKTNMKNSLILLCTLTFLISCSPAETTTPEKAYEYWAGVKPPEDMKIFNGEYTRTLHFTLEYEFILKFKPSKKWWDGFISINNLEIDTVKNDWSKFAKLPKWFHTNSNYLIYCRDQNDKFDRSRYFINPSTGICYIYETVGM
jgi:hypothetical protein